MLYQLFVFDRWNNFVGTAHIEPQKTVEVTAHGIIEQALRDLTAALNSEARHD